jgi:hypothetical protein
MFIDHICTVNPRMDFEWVRPSHSSKTVELSTAPAIFIMEDIQVRDDEILEDEGGNYSFV